MKGRIDVRHFSALFFELYERCFLQDLLSFFNWGAEDAAASARFQSTRIDDPTSRANEA